MTLTAQELSRLRQDVGDTGTTPAFSNEELNDIYTDEGESWNRAILRCIWRLLNNAAKFNDYTQNQTTERKQQVFANLERLYKLQLDVIAAEESAQQPSIVGLKRVPPHVKPVPYGDPVPDNLRRRRGRYW